MFRKEYLLYKETVHGGERFLFRFPNGYTAEVIRNALTLGGLQGLWEVRYVDPDTDKYTIEGYCTAEQVNKLLEELKTR
jgi:hypothetical protein